MNPTAPPGELTLRGLVLPVGGLKEKLLAAAAAGMARVLLPARSMPDVQVRLQGGAAAGGRACRRRGSLADAAAAPASGACRQPLLFCLHSLSATAPDSWLPAPHLQPPLQADVPAEVRAALQVVPCARLEDVLRAAFDPPIELVPQPLLARL